MNDLSQHTSTRAACNGLGVARATLYRLRQPAVAPIQPPGSRSIPSQALSEPEKMAVRQTLNSDRFMDCPPRQVYATLLDEGTLDEGTYVCHWRTMYRILAEHAETVERRDQRRHPVYPRPHLLATAPRQVWSWDITRLSGPARGLWFYLYVVLDLFSRFVVGWLIADRECADLAQTLIAQSCAREHIQPHQLTLHNDRGAPMTAHPFEQLLVTLGITRSLSRPRTSNDNPFSEAQFKTLKYRPTFPDRFAHQAAACDWASDFFDWYNHDHHHTGLALLTPAQVHFGLTEAVLAVRQQALCDAYAAHPERFTRRPPVAPAPPTQVWINPPLFQEVMPLSRSPIP